MNEYNSFVWFMIDTRILFEFTHELTVCIQVKAI